METMLVGCRMLDKLYEHDPLSKAVAIICEKRLAALPVLNEHDELVGVIGVNGLLGLLLPKVVRSTLKSNTDVMPNLSFVDDNVDELRGRLRELSAMTVGELANRDAPVIYPDSPAMEAVLLLLRGEDDVPMVERGTRKFRCMVSALDFLHGLNEGTDK